MELDLYRVDAFTSEVFKGNPACVMLMTEWPSDQTLRLIAQENAVAETAFLIHRESNVYDLRWFTPDVEMDLCGHATLASAHVVLSELTPSTNEVMFDTLSGRLVVTRDEHGYEMTLPNRAPEHAILPVEIEEALNLKFVEVYKSRDYLLVYRNQREVEAIDIRRDLFDRINLGSGGHCDCTWKSHRFRLSLLHPSSDHPGRPSNGSPLHLCTPLGRASWQNHAASSTTLGAWWELHCQVLPNHVLVRGEAVLYSKARVFLHFLRNDRSLPLSC